MTTKGPGANERKDNEIDNNKTPSVRKGRTRTNAVNYSRLNQTDRLFEGSTPEIGGVLAMPVETYVRNRVSFEKIKSLLETYLVKTFNGADDIMGAVTNQKIP